MYQIILVERSQDVFFSLVLLLGILYNTWKNYSDYHFHFYKQNEAQVLITLRWENAFQNVTNQLLHLIRSVFPSMTKLKKRQSLLKLQLQH
jgi:hypothetical protein